ncbi:hypothetical protein FHX52_3788 [Humibacillus xanthopallidus]|uniref:Uncharacterized protein n=1 Tax=Humibacillus xanthopallidus TaxID=412689 RepID=A0A543PKG2_9MICO|nr:hypothetical protein [Humibacillus xanthopallidus]TQN44572.1 hypothetical protein FHX52_3788 [Humibacillus xanthopallidus]HET7799874.1 hypothetical protein [Humibacillus xanthopallidus]
MSMVTEAQFSTTNALLGARLRAQAAVGRRLDSEYRAIWIVVFILGIFIIGAAALAIYCISRGRSGGVIDFNVSKWYKGWIPVGIRVEIKCV